MKNKEIEELLNDMSKVYEAHVKIIDKYNNADEIHYASPISLKQINLLLSYIEQLEKKIDQYENPDDLTLFYMWLDTKAKDKIKQLEKRNKELYEGFMATQEELTNYATENEQLENNRDKAIEYIEEIISSTKGVINDYIYNKEHNKQLIELLNEDVEMYKHILNILKGDNDE